MVRERYPMETFMQGFWENGYERVQRRNLVGGQFLRLLVVDSDDDTDDDGNDNDDEQDDEQAPPLLPVACARTDDRSTDFLVTLCDVLADFLALLLDVGDERLLLLHDLIEVLEELCKLHHLALDVLDGLVALLDVAQGRAGLAAAV